MANALAGHVLPTSLSQSFRQKIQPARATTAAFARPAFRFRSARRSITRAANEKEADLSGEWPVNWSLASYEDVGEFFKNSLFKEDAGNLLKDVMATSVKSVTPDTTLDSIGNLFDSISGVPVTKRQSDKTLVGGMSKKDLKKASFCDCGLNVQSTSALIFANPSKCNDLVLFSRVDLQLGMSCQHLPLQPDLTTRWQMQL